MSLGLGWGRLEVSLVEELMMSLVEELMVSLVEEQGFSAQFSLINVPFYSILIYIDTHISCVS
jgi:hypothetical protein